MAIIPDDTSNLKVFPQGIITINSLVPETGLNYTFEDETNYEFEDGTNYDFE